MTTIMAKKKKKKGRPSLLDLQKRSLKQQLRQNPNFFELPTNPRPSSEFVAGDEDDERKEKKHKLVLGFNPNPNPDSDSTFSPLDDPNVSLKKRKFSDVGSSAQTSQKVLKATDNSVVGHGSQVESGPTTPLPDKKLLLFILDRLQKKDSYGVFSEPVDPEELPDYHEIISNPMDFRTVMQKLDRGAYTYLEQFEDDIMLICSNAMEYNSSDTVYFRQAKCIQELAKKDFDNLREESDDSEPAPPPKIVRRGRPPGKNKKSSETSPFEFFSPVSFSNATPLLQRDNPNGSSVYNLRKAPIPNKFRSSDSLNGIYHGAFGTETGPSWVSEWENEFPTSVLRNVLKYGSKRFSIDENKRDTYTIPSASRSAPSPLTLLDGEQKHLVEVGDPYLEHSYTRSLVQFTASLGPVVQRVALNKIQSILPDYLKFATYDVVKTQLLSQNAFVRNQSESASLNTQAFKIQQNSSIQPWHNVSNSHHVSYIQPQIYDTPIRRPSQGEDSTSSQMLSVKSSFHSQPDSQVYKPPSDMNVGFQACLPGSVVQMGSPKQPDLALQLRMGW